MAAGDGIGKMLQYLVGVDDVEAMTGELAMRPVDALGADAVERAIALAVPLSRHVIDAEVVPVPNPIGVPRP